MTGIATVGASETDILRRKLALICMIAMSLTPFAASAASEAEAMPRGVTALGSLTIPSAQRYGIQSQEAGKPFILDVIRVDIPGAPPPAGKLPVVFVTDGDQFSALVAAIVRGAPGRFPPMIVVGIGYDTAGTEGPLPPFIQFGVRRAEHFTPSDDKTYKAFTPLALRMFERLGVPVPEPRLGQADAFLAFIDKELKPFLAARYPADVEDATLVGHSMGGLFALHVLFTAPESFKRYIILSPGAQYDDGIVFREEQARGDIAARVFMSVAGEDVPDILEATPRLDAQIRAHSRPGLRYTYRLFPGEDHLSVVPGGMMAGLRSVFDQPALPSP